MERVRVHLIIEGRVQGVCFRMYTADEARRLGLAGWVRNLSDGTVEVVAEGDSVSVMNLVQWCHHGPPHARVTKVREEYSGATGQEKDFDIRG